MKSGLKTLEGLAGYARDFFRRHWQGAVRLRDLFRWSEEAVQLVLACLVGIIGGFSNLFFHLSNELMQWLAFHHPGDPSEIADVLGSWQRLVTPALGGFAAGLVLYWGLKLVGKQGPSNLLEVVVAGDGRLPLRTGLIKTLSSLLSISTGASIGREGLITQLSATLASKLGQLARWEPYRLRLLVACGAASGMAAAYNAPIGGAVFASQIVLGNFSMHLFAPLVLSAVVATMVSRSFFGLDPWYQVPPFAFTSLTQLPWFLVLGLASGLIGAGFLKLLKFTEARFKRLAIPLYGKLALAGVGVGAIAIFYPDVWGNGYSATKRILQENPPLNFVLGLFLAKVVATVLTVGSGAVGGVFTPTLFVGATLGCVVGTLLHALHWTAVPVGVFALVGMGSVLSATVHAPLLAIIMVFELSLNYSLMPPLMLACVVSALLARHLHPDSVYTESLRDKGVVVEDSTAPAGTTVQQTVGDLMRAPVPPVQVTTPLLDIAHRFLASANNNLPVVDPRQYLVGVVALQDLKEFLNAGEELNSVIAYDIMRPPPQCLTPNQLLIDALPIILASELRHIPVVSCLNQPRLIGSVTRVEALGLLSEAISGRTLAQKSI